MRAPLLLAWLLGAAACGPDRADLCRDPDAEEPCTDLSDYGLFQGSLAEERPRRGVLPFEPVSALFSDYALKQRFVYIPPATSARYRVPDAFDLPLGSVLVKTFSFPSDMRDPSKGRRIVETRLLLHRRRGWEALPFVWSDDQRSATLRRVGATIDVEWIDGRGQRREVGYVVPNTNQCKECHEDAGKVMRVIGIKARYLNHAYPYAEGAENQLARWTREGILTGAPPPAGAPSFPAWDDEGSGPLPLRARAWLEVNCAHCHSPDGGARTSGLDLLMSQTSAYNYGVCKPPVAAGRGSGGRRFNIVPGDPDQSILQFRIESTEPDIMMPETGRQLPHEEGIALVRAWIAGLEGRCQGP